MYKLALATFLLIAQSSAQLTTPPISQEKKTTPEVTIQKAVPKPSYLLTTSKLSKETEVLLKKHNSIIDDLVKADAVMHELIRKSDKWTSEHNYIKKGQVDALIDKAERLATSSQLREQLRAQYTIASKLISDLDQNRKSLQKQRASDEKRWAMEAYMAKIKELELEKKLLQSQLNTSMDTKKKIVPGIQLSEESLQYFTVDTPMNLQSIAWKFYNDNDKWSIIYDYPSNKKQISEKSPSVIIPAGTVLAIPNLDEE
jgi:hypothetical protein